MILPPLFLHFAIGNIIHFHYLPSPRFCFSHDMDMRFSSLSKVVNPGNAFPPRIPRQQLTNPLYLSRLAAGHGLGHETLEGELLLLQLLGGGVVDLKGAHRVADGGLDLVLLATLELERQRGVRDELLDVGDVVLEVLLSLEALVEGLVVALELLGICPSVSSCVGGLEYNDGKVLPLIMPSISADESLPTELLMVMLALRPEVFSVAVTLRIPLTSTSKTTSRTGSPAFMGGMGARVNSPREVLSSQLTRSPWKTGNCTVCCMSATVVKVLFLMVGTVWPRDTTGAKMLPSMATPSDRGTTSRRRRSAVSAEVALPERIPAWTAAP